MLRTTALGLSLLSLLSGAAALAEVQMRCDGTLLTARGAAEAKRTAHSLVFSLRLAAEGADADAALASLQARLAAVREALQALAVEELRVTSPSTWRRTEPRRRVQHTASLQVSGRLKAERLQPLIRQVGALPGVTLAPVSAQADPADDERLRRQLLREAYRNAVDQAMDVAAAIGRTGLTPLEVSLEGGMPPVPVRAMAADAAPPPPFTPGELPPPTDRAALLVRFCAR